MVVIPYPLRLDSVRRGADDSEDFNRALAFATVSGDIALDEGPTPDSVANELALIGQRTGFTSYALLGTPEYLVQFRLIRNLVLSNALLVVCTLALLAAVLLGLAAVVSWQLSSLRRGRDVALWNLGSSWAYVRGVAVVSNLLYWFLTMALFLLSLLAMPGGSLAALGLCLAVAVVLGIFENLLDGALLKRALVK